MKKLLIILLLSSPAWAGQKYRFSDPKLNDEIDNIYYTIKNVSSEISSPLNIAQISVSTLTVTSSMTIIGTKLADDAPAGAVGEYIESKVTANQNFPASTQYGDATSISLTPGDWDITVQLHCNQSASSVSLFEAGVSATSGNSGVGLQAGDSDLYAGLPASSGFTHITVANVRKNISATTTYYFKVSATYTGATPVYQGRISARRIR